MSQIVVDLPGATALVNSVKSKANALKGGPKEINPAYTSMPSEDAMIGAYYKSMQTMNNLAESVSKDVEGFIAIARTYQSADQQVSAAAETLADKPFPVEHGGAASATWLTAHTPSTPAPTNVVGASPSASQESGPNTVNAAPASPAPASSPSPAPSGSSSNGLASVENTPQINPNPFQ